MSPPGREDPAAAVNQVLSEVIDAILDVRQAHRRVPETQALHAVLDQLFADLRRWAQLLADQDQALGVSPLASMRSGAGRTTPNLWHGAASNAEVRRIVGEHLDGLAGHLAVALAEPQDDEVRAALTEVGARNPDVQAHDQQFRVMLAEQAVTAHSASRARLGAGGNCGNRVVLLRCLALRVRARLSSRPGGAG